MKNRIGTDVIGKKEIIPKILIPKNQKVAKLIEEEIKGKTIKSLQFVRREGEFSYYDLHFTDETTLRIFGKLIKLGTRKGEVRK